MAEFTITAQDLRSALQALKPFVPRPTKRDDEQQEDIAVVLGHLVQDRELILTTVGAAGTAVAVLPLVDWDGELTDFAIHTSDVPTLITTFRRPDRAVDVTIRHHSYTVPAMREGQAEQHMRNTLIALTETGQLFGAATITLAGCDAREIDVANAWASLAIETAGPFQTSTAIPGRICALTSAAEKAYGGDTRYAVSGSRQVVATVGDAFLAGMWVQRFTDDGSDRDFHERTRSTWRTTMDRLTSQAPNHHIYR